jgi:hypothetical protein
VRIRTNDNTHSARKVAGAGRDHSTYRCFPRNRERDASGIRRNEVQDEIQFPTVQEAAQYLVAHPGAGIRMQPNAVIYDNIIIDMDGEEP